MPPTSPPMPPSMTGPMWMPHGLPTWTDLIAVHPQPVPVLPVFALLLLVAYLVGVAFLRRRGHGWPVQRTAWWVAGCITVLSMTATGVDGYGMELFSVHMVQHMVLSMLAPVFLVLAAPITLVLRVLPARREGFNARALLLTILHSGVARFITHPVVTMTLFLMSLYGLYFTPIFDYLMGTWWGHNAMLLHFLGIGMLYFWGVMGVDPSPRQAPRGIRRMSPEVLRIFELFVTVPFHAFFGVVIMTSVTLVVGFYAAPMPGWGISPLGDQRVGGGIAWAFTEIPTLIVLSVLFYQWQKSESRNEARLNRKAERNRDADLSAYNRYLASLAVHDETVNRR